MASKKTGRTRLKHPYITRKKGVCGGKPIIRGTRIKVSQIVLEYERWGWTPDEIVQAHPHLTLAQVHDALSYYYENVDEIERQMAEERRMVAELQAKIVSTQEQQDKGRGPRSDLSG